MAPRALVVQVKRLVPDPVTSPKGGMGTNQHRLRKDWSPCQSRRSVASAIFSPRSGSSVRGQWLPDVFPCISAPTGNFALKAAIQRTQLSKVIRIPCVKSVFGCLRCKKGSRASHKVLRLLFFPRRLAIVRRRRN
jgi:hypothetical protein